MVVEVEVLGVVAGLGLVAVAVGVVVVVGKTRVSYLVVNPS